jgi:hypothetical protein
MFKDSITGKRQSVDTMSGAKRGPLAVLERIGLAAASMLVSINVCTGFPALALWIGSRAADGNVFSWLGIITAIVSLGVLATLGVMSLTRLSARYNKVTGRRPPPRQPRPWQLSMSTARAASERARRATNPVEVIVVVTVVVAFEALVIWFVFFAGPPVGRG